MVLFSEDELDNMVGDMMLSEEALDNMVGSMTLSEETLDTMVGDMMLSEEAIDDIIGSTSVSEGFAESITTAYDSTDFGLIEEETKFENQIGEVSHNISIGEKAIFTIGTLNLLIRDILQDSGNRFVFALAITSILTPLIIEDPDVKKFEQILTRLYWGTMIIYYVIDYDE